MTFSDTELKRLKEFKEKYQYFNLSNAWEMNEAYDLLEALLSRLELAEKTIEEYRDKLADMHEVKGCLFDNPKLKPEDAGCMACWAFNFADEAYLAWRKAKGEDGVKSKGE